LERDASETVILYFKVALFVCLTENRHDRPSDLLFDDESWVSLDVDPT
jgi:hypothetical protein